MGKKERTKLFVQLYSSSVLNLDQSVLWYILCTGARGNSGRRTSGSGWGGQVRSGKGAGSARMTRKGSGVRAPLTPAFFASQNDLDTVPNTPSKTTAPATMYAM